MINMKYPCSWESDVAAASAFSSPRSRKQSNLVPTWQIWRTALWEPGTNGKFRPPEVYSIFTPTWSNVVSRPPQRACAMLIHAWERRDFRSCFAAQFIEFSSYFKQFGDRYNIRLQSISFCVVQDGRSFSIMQISGKVLLMFDASPSYLCPAKTRSAFHNGTWCWLILWPWPYWHNKVNLV